MNFNGNKVSAANFNENPLYRIYFNGELVFPLLVDAPTQPTSAMTSLTAPSPYVVNYSSRYSDTYAAWKAFTNSISTQGWACASGNKGSLAWVSLDLGSGKKLRNPVVQLWNRNNNNVNGAYNAFIYGANTAASNGSGSNPGKLPSDAVCLGEFTGLDGDTKSAKAVLDTVGNTTSGATRTENIGYMNNALNFGFRYIFIGATSWNEDGGTYLNIGQIRIDGKFES